MRALLEKYDREGLDPTGWIAVEGVLYDLIMEIARFR